MAWIRDALFAFISASSRSTPHAHLAHRKATMSNGQRKSNASLHHAHTHHSAIPSAVPSNYAGRRTCISTLSTDRRAAGLHTAALRSPFCSKWCIANGRSRIASWFPPASRRRPTPASASGPRTAAYSPRSCWYTTCRLLAWCSTCFQEGREDYKRVRRQHRAGYIRYYSDQSPQRQFLYIPCLPRVILTTGVWPFT